MARHVLDLLFVTCGAQLASAFGIPFNASSIQPCQTYHYSWNASNNGPFDLTIRTVDSNVFEMTRIAAINAFESDFPMFYPSGRLVNLTVVASLTKAVIKSDLFTVHAGSDTSCIVNVIPNTTSQSSNSLALTPPTLTGRWGPCDTPLFQWSGGTPPYTFKIESDRLLPSLNPFYRIISNVSTTALSFALQFPQFTAFQISVQDSAGTSRTAVPYKVQPGSDLSCLNPSWNVTVPPGGSNATPTSNPTATHTGPSSATIGYIVMAIFLFMVILLGLGFLVRHKRRQQQLPPPPYTRVKRGETELDEVPPPYE